MKDLFLCLSLSYKRILFVEFCFILIEVALVVACIALAIDKHLHASTLCMAFGIIVALTLVSFVLRLAHRMSEREAMLRFLELPSYEEYMEKIEKHDDIYNKANTRLFEECYLNHFSDDDLHLIVYGSVRIPDQPLQDATTKEKQ